MSDRRDQPARSDGDADLSELPAPDHGPSFWSDLDAGLNSVDRMMTSDRTDRTDSNLHRMVPLVAAAVVALVVGLAAGRLRSPTSPIDTIDAPRTTATGENASTGNVRTQPDNTIADDQTTADPTTGAEAVAGGDDGRSWSVPEPIASVATENGLDGPEALVHVTNEPGRSWFVYLERTDTGPGCYGPQREEVEHRLVRYDPDTDTRSVLLERLLPGRRLIVDDDGNVALVAECRDGVQVEAMGRLDPNGNLDLRALAEERNVDLDPTNYWDSTFVWSPDGERLYTTGQVLDTTTGEVLSQADGQTTLWVHAELADTGTGGQLLVSAPAPDGYRRDLWLVPIDHDLAQRPDGEPLLTIFPDGLTIKPVDHHRRLVLRLYPTDAEAEAYLIDGTGLVDDDVTEVGFGLVAPDGSATLESWDGVDVVTLLAGGEQFVVPHPTPPSSGLFTQWATWCCDGQAVLWFVADSSTTTIYRSAPPS